MAHGPLGARWADVRESTIGMGFLYTPMPGPGTQDCSRTHRGRDFTARNCVKFPASSAGGKVIAMRIGSAPVGLFAALSWAPGCGGMELGTEVDSSGGTNDTQEFAAVSARGISIVEVELNQGTRIPIGVGGEWVDEAARLGPLVGSRDSVMRVHFRVDDGWVPREIEARLTLELPDGTSRSLVDRQMVEGDSNPGDVAGPFYFELATELGETVAGTRYLVELWETQPGGEHLNAGTWANPTAGPQPIGFEAGPMQIKLVLVPITYQDTTVNLDEATTWLVLDNLYEQNPTNEIIYAVHDPVAYDGQLIDLANVLPILAQLRGSESAEPNVYYHAFIDVGGASIGGVQGISGIAGATEGDAGDRVSATVLWSPNPALAAATFTHEAGHAQGLFHVECADVDAAETNDAYPHEGGRIGNWGFGILQSLIFAPDETYDYMSYCAPSWVSDWTWNQTHERIRTLTAWDSEGAARAREPLGQLVVVAVSADGRRRWWTMPGTIDPARVDGMDRLEFETPSGETIEVPAESSTLSDGRTRWVAAELPSGLVMADVATIHHVRGGEIASTTAAALGLGVAPTSSWTPNWKRFRPR